MVPFNSLPDNIEEVDVIIAGGEYDIILERV
jgi:hypothetical protein